MLATFEVNVDYDAAAPFDFNDDIVTLREAVFRSNQVVDHDIVSFASNLNGGTIELTHGALTITDGATIDASMLDLGVTVDASGNDSTPNNDNGGGTSVFSIEAPREAFGRFDVTLDSLKITGGDSQFDGGGIAYFNSTAEGVLTIRDCQVFGNASQSSGGGIKVDSRDIVLIDRCKIWDNSSGGDGGGITLIGESTLDVLDTVISGNTSLLGSSHGGGGLYARLRGQSEYYPAVLTVERSSISGNTAQMKGGGFFVLPAGADNDKFVLSNSTVSGNHALNGVGGGGYVCQKFGGKFEAINSTISGNDALHPNPLIGRGGGLAIARETSAPAIDSYLNLLTITDNEATSDGGLYSANDSLVRTYVDNTIISGNRNGSGQPSNVGGNIENTSSYNLFGTGGSALLTVGSLGPGNLLENNTPLLGPLTYNGGPMFIDGSKMETHALQWNSPARDVGDPAAVAGEGDVPDFDQRGPDFERVVGNRIDIGAFEYFLLVGDYDLNGSVECYDFQLWIDTFGSTTDLRADGNGNGVVDAADYTVWADAFDWLMGRPIGDFNGDLVVNAADYIVWQMNFGSTTNLDADANCNGIVDAADYTIWRDTFGSTIGAAKFGLLGAAFGPNIPPEVVGFALAATGPSGFDFTASVGSGEQLRSVPLAGANSISLTFNQDVVISQNDLTLLNLDGTAPSIASFDYNTESQTATWILTTPFSDGRYLLRLADTVEDTDNEALDGEFTNPWALAHTGSDVFPSGDGVAGGEFRFRFTVLAGDSDRNNIHGAANYQNWLSAEPGMVYVSTTADEYDGDLTFGDVSLREAVNNANTASEPTTIVLPTGKYTLSRTGTETTANVAFNDLDILNIVKIVGDGPGFSIIDNSGLTSAPSTQARTFGISGVGKRLKLTQLTVANGASFAAGQVAEVLAGATLDIFESAVVNHTTYAGGTAINVSSGNLSISRSVFSNNDVTANYGGSAVSVWGSSTAPASITVGETIFAQNVQPAFSGPGTRIGIQVTGTVTKVNQGKNLYDYAGGNFFNTTPGIGDYLGTPTYVVTSTADTFNHADDLEALSLREAVDLANSASTPAEIWVPAWNFKLTRDRGSNVSDIDVAYGDLDVKKSMTIRGVADRTRVEWKPGIVDKVFDVLGDGNSDGQADHNSVSSADYTIWQDQNGSTGALEQFSADWDDDGDVDQADHTIWTQNFGHTLQLMNVFS